MDVELNFMKIVDKEKNEIIYDGEYRKIIYPIYNEKEDITVIFQDVIQNDADATVISTEVIGFYYGVPDVETMEKYIGRLKANYENLL